MNNQELEKKLTHILHDLRWNKGYISSVDALTSLGYLTEKARKDWVTGRVPYMEKVCTVNLKKLGLISKIIRSFAKQQTLKRSLTPYIVQGTRDKKLRFSKSGEPNLEQVYATHYIDKKRTEQLEAARFKAEQQKLNEENALEGEAYDSPFI